MYRFGSSFTGNAYAYCDNLIAANAQAGIYCPGSTPVVSNNTIVGNNTGVSSSSSSPQLANNIVAYNAIGISASGVRHRAAAIDGRCRHPHATSAVDFAPHGA